MVLLAALVALLLLAPPDSNAFWAVNGVRSLPQDGRVAVVVAALLVGALVAVRPRGAVLWTTLSAIIAWAVAFPLREKIHFLGDTHLRIRTMVSFSERAATITLEELFRGLHATPLDAVLNFFVPVAIQRAGLSAIGSLSVVSLVLAAVFLAGVWRLGGRIESLPHLRVPAALALVLTGVLQAFAGYAESTGLLLALAPWWWAEMLSTVSGWRKAIRITAVWGVMILAHRLALVMVVPMMWRALGPAMAGDTVRARRILLAATGVVFAGCMGVLRLTLGPRQIGTDFADAFALLRGESGVGLLSPIDTLNLLFVVAPLLFLAPLVAGAAAFRTWVRSAESRLLLAAAVPLLPLALVLPAGPHGLGAHRDWDLAALCGWTLTLAGVSMLTRAPEGRRRAALLLVLPVMALAAGSWISVNAHESASIRRAVVLASREPRPATPHLGAVHTYLGQRSMDFGEPRRAAGYYERAYAFSPNPRFLLLAAEAWLVYGAADSARSAIDRARASGGLNARSLEAAERLENMIETREATADSADASS